MRTGKIRDWGVLLVVALVLSGCASMPGATGGSAQPPQVKLQRVEVASYFPYAAPPARVPLVLGFIFGVSNPNESPVALEEMKFTVSFEAKPGEFFALSTPTIYEKMSIPGRTTNQLRVVSVLDSLVVPGNLAVSSGSRVAELGLKPADVVKDWWEKIGDFSFGIKVSEGVALFNGASMVVSFEDTFPKN